MSSTIWTQCADKSKHQFFSGRAWRLVEDQHQVSTRKLVDSDLEQERLEHLIDAVKPPMPRMPGLSRLHYLLSTPFRYPPLHHGSRFRSPVDPGVWYGSMDLDTALAEKAYYRFRFLSDTAAPIRSEVLMTAFPATLSSSHAIDLTQAPFDAFEDRISDPNHYTDSQPLGRALREDHVALCLYRSARDPRRGLNTAVFSPDGFRSVKITDSDCESWHCYATRSRVEFRARRFNDARTLHFDRVSFEIDGHLPQP